MNTLPMKPLKSGLVNFPGATPESTALVAELLHKDYVAHHCFHNDQNFSNHLSHHILSLHDLGAPIEWIRAMYEKEAATQRPLHLNGVPANKASAIDETNWTSKLGRENANRYSDYLSFFSGEIGKRGVHAALERYVFSPEANANGTFMLARFIGGLLHPIIETGLGLEFGQDFMVAQGLAQAALATPVGAGVMHVESGIPKIRSGSSATLLSLFRELYDAPELTPAPYETQQITPERLGKWVASNPERAAAIRDIYAKWTFNIQDGNEEDFAKKVEECMWQATLLLGATGKPNRKPRMDFYLMHFLTGSLFLGVVVEAIKSPLHKAQLLQAYVRSAALFIILRGRPRIDLSLVMSYPVCPTPPKTPNSVVGSVGSGGSGSPWLALLNNATMHTEPHVVKSIRMLFYCAQKYGGTPGGGVIGAVDGGGKETHKGAATLDGTLFVRVAGNMTDAVGWVAHGDNERFWDFGGIGWEEAWIQDDV
ncbi:hypothetical protein C8F04DRAFT_1121265 [Mycena alexandri]|uniref:Oxidoreductase AflY n=1 Tax=Mycena alexandri TaxID=1745969 RepID=A0AAD6SLG0_9AGAR|nr:hypothetical protein C8F04DRAFT_1121265 [Mycena alexandri]